MKKCKFKAVRTKEEQEKYEIKKERIMLVGVLVLTAVGGFAIGAIQQMNELAQKDWTPNKGSFLFSTKGE